MPEEPGPRHTGGASHASDSPRCDPADTPYGGAASVPISTRTVGGAAYVHVADNERRATQ